MKEHSIHLIEAGPSTAGQVAVKDDHGGARQGGASTGE